MGRGVDDTHVKTDGEKVMCQIRSETLSPSEYFVEFGPCASRSKFSAAKNPVTDVMHRVPEDY